MINKYRPCFALLFLPLKLSSDKVDLLGKFRLVLSLAEVSSHLKTFWYGMESAYYLPEGVPLAVYLSASFPSNQQTTFILHQIRDVES